MFCYDSTWPQCIKIMKIVSFEFSRQKWHLSSSIVNFWNIWIFAPKIINFFKILLLIFGAKIQIFKHCAAQIRFQLHETLKWFLVDGPSPQDSCNTYGYFAIPSAHFVIVPREKQGTLTVVHNKNGSWRVSVKTTTS